MKKILNRVAVWLPMLTLFLSGAYLIYWYWDYRTAENAYDRLSEYVSVPSEQIPEHSGKRQIKTTDETESVQERPDTQPVVNQNEAHPELPIVDWDAMHAYGKDIKAWLEIPCLGVSYPVVQGKDNDEYLHHLPDGEYKSAGSLFMDCRNADTFNDLNTIIYGHNMKSGAMFGSFRDFSQDNYDSESRIWVLTPKETLVYRIVSFHVSDVGDESYTLFKNPDEKQSFAWIRGETEKSEISADLPAEYKNNMLTLSTCTSRSDQRRVLQGILVERIRENNNGK